MIGIREIEEEFELTEEDSEFRKLFDKQDEYNNKQESQKKEIKKGRIVRIDDTNVMVDIGQKAEAKMSIDELKDDNGEIVFGINDEIDLLVSSVNGNVKISHKQALKHKKIQAVIEKIKDNYTDKIINVSVIKRDGNEFIAKWIEEDVECILPKRYAAIKHDTKTFPKHIKVCIKNINDDKIIVSQKRYFDINKQHKSEKIEEILKAESPLKGEVVGIKEFGIFVNIDGVEGLVHSSEISHKNFVNPINLYKIGDNVLVKVLKYDSEKSKLSLSIKALQPDPWSGIEKIIQVGDTIKVIVSSIQPYGAFVDAGNDIEGFLHITEISWDKNVKKPDGYVKVGDELDVEIIELEPAKKRLRVSLKKLSDKPFIQFAKTHKEGDIVSGEIATITDFGAFVRLGNIDGLLHNEDLSWNKQDKCKDKLKIGDKVEVKIIKIDKENEKISLSKKALLPSPIADFIKTKQINDIVSGKVIEIKDFGIFVSLEDNIDALIKNEDLAPLKKDEVKIGDTIEAVILHIDTQNNKIRLSVKKLARKKEQNEIKNFNSDEKMTLGDILKDRLR